MSFKKLIVGFMAIASIGIVVLSIMPSDSKSGLFSFSKSVVTHSLTGLEGKDGPVYIVKIDDTTNAHPQIGVGDADIVYIEQVEGGLTRLAAVFSSKLPALVGPVRSARISDIELVAQYGRVAFSYSGAQRKFLPVLAAANIVDIGATHYGPRFYFNDPNRIPPYAMVLRLPEIISEMTTRGEVSVTSQSIGFTFDYKQPAQENSFTFSGVTMKWPAAKYEARWSESEKRFLLTHDGVVNVDDKGINVGPENILIQKVSITNSEYKDKVGGITPLIGSVGEGECYLLRNGDAQKCSWSRPTSQSGTTITGADGRILPFSPGRTWVALVDKEPVFAGLKVASPAPSSSK